VGVAVLDRSLQALNAILWEFFPTRPAPPLMRRRPDSSPGQLFRTWPGRALACSVAARRALQSPQDRLTIPSCVPIPRSSRRELFRNHPPGRGASTA
jgi:hypothetical protein